MKLLDFIRKFTPKKGAAVCHPMLNTDATIKVSSSNDPVGGLSPRLVVMDEVNDDHQDVMRYMGFDPARGNDYTHVAFYTGPEGSMTLTRIERIPRVAIDTATPRMSRESLLNIKFLNTFGAPLESFEVDFGMQIEYRIDGIVVSVPYKKIERIKNPRVMFRYLRARFSPLFRRRRSLRTRLEYARLEPWGA